MLPGLLEPAFEASRRRLVSLAPPEVVAQLDAAVAGAGLSAEFNRLLATSGFAAEQIGRYTDWVLAGLADGSLLGERSRSAGEWDAAARVFLGDDPDEQAFLAGLRRFRQCEMIRLVWRDFAHRASLECTLGELTSLADCAVRLAVAQAVSLLKPRFGEPIGDQSGRVQTLVVLALGKHGGGELNLSSDIDLIFVYAEAGQTTGGRKVTSNQEYFIRLGQTVIRLLDATTPEGFVFRVDMRLRPYGNSGALVCSYDALELYYQDQGREWERYALMKARPVTGNPAELAPLNAMIRAFVYRRYTDFGVIEALREMKAMIEAEVKRLNLGADIKKGAGGIREIEFITQCLQLIHGGRNPSLQVRGTREAIAALVEAELLPADTADDLRAAYDFLRRLEHGLQGMEDRQTQTLPEDPESRLKLAVILGFDDWQALAGELDRVRKRVSGFFREFIAVRDPDTQGQQRLANITTLDAQGLEELGFGDPEAVVARLRRFLDQTRIRYLQGDSRQRLERFLPRLLEALAGASAPEAALERLLPFLEAVSRRSAYLVLLEENPPVLAEMVFLADSGPWFVERLIQRPELLDELLDAGRLYTAPTREDVQSLVRQQLLRVPEDDLEQQMYTLSRIKDGVVLRVAASELAGRLPVMKVSDNLTFLAEEILAQAIHVARVELVNRHGEPGGDAVGFAVMGYGKLGGIELSYGSDLDLVFVFDGGIGSTAGPRVVDNTRFFTRLAQRVVHVLATKLASGRLYDVDLRLRPNGDSGLVAVSLNGFAKYQRESAWTWEHQALVRARPVAGDPELLEQLGSLRREILCQQRDPDALAREVADMRRRMLESGESRIRGNVDQFDLKLDPGGIVDIEFVVQYLVLAHANTYPELARWSDVVRILDTLQAVERIPERDAVALRSAYLSYRAAVHRAGITGEKVLGKVTEFAGHLNDVAAIRNRYLPLLADLPVPGSDVGQREH